MIRSGEILAGVGVATALVFGGACDSSTPHPVSGHTIELQQMAKAMERLAPKSSANFGYESLETKTTNFAVATKSAGNLGRLYLSAVQKVDNGEVTMVDFTQVVPGVRSYELTFEHSHNDIWTAECHDKAEASTNALAEFGQQKVRVEANPQYDSRVDANEVLRTDISEAQDIIRIVRLGIDHPPVEVQPDACRFNVG